MAPSRPAPKKKSSASRPSPKKKSATPAKPSKGKPAASAKPKPTAKPSTTKGAAKPSAVVDAPVPELPSLPPPLLGNEPMRILSLAFVRDGDEFLARLEGAGGHITELKNRSLDQLLTMVAGELEDLLG